MYNKNVMTNSEAIEAFQQEVADESRYDDIEDFIDFLCQLLDLNKISKDQLSELESLNFDTHIKSE